MRDGWPKKEKAKGLCLDWMVYYIITSIFVRVGWWVVEAITMEFVSYFSLIPPVDSCDGGKW